MNRSTVLLIGFLLVLGAIAYFLLPSEKERETSYKTPELFFSVDSASVVKLEIQHAEKSVVIENVGGRWTLTSPVHFPADPGTVSRLIGGLSKFKIGSLISTNPDKQHIFQVDSSGTRLTVTDRAGKSTSVIVGKMGPSYSEIYVRLPASTDVYLGEGIDSWSVSKEAKEWRDKSIVSMPSETMKDLVYSVGGKQYNFHRDSTTWKLGGKAIETNMINPSLNTLASLRADDFVDTAMKFRSRPITVNVKGGEDVTLSLYPVQRDSSKYFIQSSSSQQVYMISKWTAQQLFKPVEQYLGGNRYLQLASSKPKEEPNPDEVDKTRVSKDEKTFPPSTSSKSQVEKAPPVSEQKPPETPSEKKSESQPSPVQQSSAPSTEKTTSPLVKDTAQKAPEDEGELTVHTVKRGETMEFIAKKYHVTIDQILKWNLLKSIAVKPGQELYIFEKK